MENIEAMLCAYIEGDLDEAGRAQIEKHLQEHPQHRKLIAALTATRDLMRELPRAKAPADVGEWLHGQVERSILLDDSDPMAAAQRAKPSRWPQWLGVAAVLLLFAALGVIVMRMVMPTFRPPVLPVASSTRAPSPAPAETDITAKENEQMNGAAMQAGRPLLLKVAPMQVVPPVQFDMEVVRRRLQNSGYGTAANGNNQAAPVLLVVNSSNRSTTGDQITQFLNSKNGISWRLVPSESANAPAQTPQVNQLAEANQQSFAAGPPAESPATQPAGPPASNNYASQNSQNQYALKDEVTKRSGEDESSNLDAQATTRPQADMYVAQGMTLQQADELRQSLAAQPDVQGCQVYKQLTLDVPATQPGANVNLAVGDRQETRKLAADERLSSETSSLSAATTEPTTAPAIAATSNSPADATISGALGGGFGGGATNRPMTVANIDAVIVVQPADTVPFEPSPTPATQPAATSGAPTTQPQ
jgi:hypothetical protein